MLNIYKTIDGKIQELSEFQDGSWVNLVSPTKEELGIVHSALGTDMNFLLAALDEEETSRLEQEEEQTLIIVDVPVAENDTSTILYSTMPLALILTPQNVITVSLKEVAPLAEIADGLVKDFDTTLRTRFMLKLFLRIATRYLQYLRKIDKMSTFVERQLYKSQRNKELIQLLGLEKSLVFFSTSLKATEVTLEKIFRGRIIKMYEEDADLMEDVLIEFRQAIEMANIYSSILSGTMDAFASVISNNLNVIMKILTSITIIMTVPNIIFGFFGMNVELPLQGWGVFLPSGVTIVIMVILWIILKKKDLF